MVTKLSLAVIIVAHLFLLPVYGSDKCSALFGTLPSMEAVIEAVTLFQEYGEYLNRYLRTGEERFLPYQFRPKAKAVVDTLDAIISSMSISENIIVYRGEGITTDFSRPKRDFTSATSDLKEALGFAGADLKNPSGRVLRIHLRPGQHALNVGQFVKAAVFASEREVLLPRHVSFNELSRVYDPHLGVWVYDVELREP